jgi:hypothetical protein
MGETLSVRSREGGCLCGAIRYRVEGEPLDAGYCHCRMCQRSAGAPVLAWATFKVEQVEVLEGVPLRYRSSPEAQRAFCGACGTQLWFVTSKAPLLIDVTLASLDDPASIVPEYHIWTASRIPWLDTSDHLPRHQDGGPDRVLMEAEGGGAAA